MAPDSKYTDWLAQIHKEKELLLHREREIDEERRRVKAREKELESFIREEEKELEKMRDELEAFLTSEEKRLKEREKELEQDKQEILAREKELEELEKKEQENRKPQPVDESVKKALAHKEQALRKRESEDDELFKKEQELREWEEKLRKKEMQRLNQLQEELTRKEEELLRRERELDRPPSTPASATPPTPATTRPRPLKQPSTKPKTHPSADTQRGALEKKISQVDGALVTERVKSFQSKKEQRLKNLEDDMLATLRELKQSIDGDLKEPVLDETAENPQAQKASPPADGEADPEGPPDDPRFQKKSMPEKGRLLVYLKLENDAKKERDVSVTDHLPPKAVDVQVHSKTDLKTQNDDYLSWQIHLKKGETRILHYSMKSSTDDLPDASVEW